MIEVPSTLETEIAAGHSQALYCKNLFLKISKGDPHCVPKDGVLSLLEDMGGYQIQQTKILSRELLDRIDAVGAGQISFQQFCVYSKALKQGLHSLEQGQTTDDPALSPYGLDSLIFDPAFLDERLSNSGVKSPIPSRVTAIVNSTATMTAANADAVQSIALMVEKERVKKAVVEVAGHPLKEAVQAREDTMMRVLMPQPQAYPPAIHAPAPSLVHPPSPPSAMVAEVETVALDDALADMPLPGIVSLEPEEVTGVGEQQDEGKKADEVQTSSQRLGEQDGVEHSAQGAADALVAFPASTSLPNAAVTEVSQDEEKDGDGGLVLEDKPQLYK